MTTICKICKRKMEEHTKGDLFLCAARLKVTEEEENAARRKKGYDTNSEDGGVFTFDS